MQAIILMAGKGTRMAKYYEGPKQLLPVLGKPVVHYLLDSLPAEITELIFIVGGPHEEKIRSHFASGEYNGRSITFIRQGEQLGLPHAFGMAKDVVKDKWFGSVADDIFDPVAIQALVKEDMAILSSKVSNPEQFGVLVTDEEGNLVRAVEKPQEFVSDLVWTGAMVMDKTFFETKTELSARGEYETPDVWTKLVQEQGKKIKVITSSYWFPVNDKPQLEAAEAKMKELGLV
jgi:UDP-N-acetylglucosamine diphosphorylase / glucose-1-phosphate thymidylyltransferase / UDP-N-acetylgalactosamine diphosphorylase / glucosamine-1-phosphate N-acetyltransferase / galactosamine-1-phosphate N-acetyltransferase